jgi:peptidoglycan/LPS O-acetylase OafA/YrhL
VLHARPGGPLAPWLQWLLFPPELLFYAFQFWVVATMLHPRSLTTRLLEWEPLRFIGRLSYSIYLWHALFIVGRLPQVALNAHGLLFLTGRPWRYLATAACALASYYWVERPMIRLGHKLAPPATPGHLDLQAATNPVLSTVGVSGTTAGK